MRKKTSQEYVAKPGFHSDTGISAKCVSCKQWIELGERMYWRKTNAGTEIFCSGCCDKE